MVSTQEWIKENLCTDKKTNARINTPSRELGQLMWSKQGVRKCWIYSKIICLALQNIKDLRDCIQICLDSQIPPSNGHEDFVTAKKKFSRYFLAYPTKTQSAETISIVNRIWTQLLSFLQQDYPTGDQHLPFKSFKKVGRSQSYCGVCHNRKTTKHTYAVEMLETTNSSLMKAHQN